MKKLIILLFCLNSVLLAMDPPPSSKFTNARTHAALQLLQNTDLDAYNAIGCYDHDFQVLIDAIKRIAPHATVQGITISGTPPADPIISLSAPNYFLLRLARWLFGGPPPPPQITSQKGYDLIFSSFAFLFNRQKARAIDIVHSQLKTGGYLIIRGLSESCAYDGLGKTISILAQQAKWKNFLKDLNLATYQFSFEHAQKLCLPHKWHNLASNAEPVSTKFAHMHALEQWVAQWIDEFPFDPALSGEKKRELAQDFTQEYASRFGLQYSGLNITIEAYKK